MKRQRATILAAVLLASPAAAQNYRNVAPPAPEPSAPPRIEVPAAPLPSGGSERVVVQKLRGIRLLGAASDVVASGVAATGVSSEGVSFGPELASVLAQYLDQPASLATLRAIEARIIALYRTEGYPFVNVVLPPQDVAAGSVQFVVQEYRLDRIDVRGNEYFSSAQIRDGVRVAPGDRIDLNAVTADLGWLNENPFRQVDMLASPGSADGTTDLNLVVHDRLPLDVSVGYGNSGNPLTGFDHWKFGLLAGDMFGQGILLGYQFTGSDDFFNATHVFPGPTGGPRFVAHAISWTIPLSSHDAIRIFGDYERVAPNLPAAFANIGHSGEASIRYDLRLPTAGTAVQQISFGYDYKTSDNNIAFGGSSIYASNPEIDQFPIIYSVTIPDRYGVTTISPRIVLSPGGLTGGNTNAAYQPGVTQDGIAHARADYVYGRLDASRETGLPEGFTWVSRLTAQLSSTNLLPSEQLSVGGMDTVRGYPSYVIGASEGVIMGQEVRAPAFALLSRVPGVGFTDSFQPDVFWDYAHIFDVLPNVVNPRAIDLSSLGIGGHYMMDKGFDLTVQGGLQLHPLPGHSGTGSFINLALMMTL